MRRFLSYFCVLFLCLGLIGCQSNEAFQEIDLSVKELQTKLEDQDDFVVIIEREECPYCEALQEYIEETKDEHPNLVLYRIDSTDFNLTKIDENTKQLQSDTKGGKLLLEMAPYFYYTPTMYVIEDGKATHAAVGYSETNHEVSLWDVDSVIDFDLADTQNFWEFLEAYE